MILNRSAINRLLFRLLLPLFNILHQHVRLLLLVKLRVANALVRGLTPLLVLLCENVVLE